jgi:cytochrome b561
MREIIRPELLWREVIPLAVAAGVVALVFLIALPSIDTDADRIEAEAAVEWTRDVIGTLIAAVATFGMFWRALNGEPLELQFGYVLALLAGLLLISIHWSLALALAAIGVALIVRGILVRAPAATAATGSAVDRPVV